MVTKCHPYLIKSAIKSCKFFQILWTFIYQGVKLKWPYLTENINNSLFYFILKYWKDILKTLYIFLCPPLLFDRKWPMFFAFKKFILLISFLFLKKYLPLRSLILIYFSLDSSESAEKSFMSSLIYLITFFIFKYICILSKTLANNSFHLS